MSKKKKEPEKKNEWEGVWTQVSENRWVCVYPKDQEVKARGRKITKGLVMTQQERDEIFHKTGVHVETRDQIKGAYKLKGLREAEPGEACYDRFDALKEKANGGTLSEEHRPENIDYMGNNFGMSEKPLDMGERFQYHLARLRAQGYTEGEE